MFRKVVLPAPILPSKEHTIYTPGTEAFIGDGSHETERELAVEFIFIPPKFKLIIYNYYYYYYYIHRKFIITFKALLFFLLY